MTNTIDEIIQGAQEVDPSVMANDVLKWLINNVDTYIDNHETVFRLYFTNESFLDMPSLGKVHEFYQKIPDDVTEADLDAVKDVLDGKVAEAKKILSTSEAPLTELFKKIICFYDMKTLVSDGTRIVPIFHDLDGFVRVNDFMYEPIAMELTVKKGFARKMEDGSLVNTKGEKEIFKKVNIPEGFALEIELEYWQVVPSTSIV
jgi:hypothetical protein